MKLTVKTSGLLGEYLPEGSMIDQAVIEVADDASVNQVLHQLGMPVDDFYLVILNDQVVPKAKRNSKILTNNDDLGIYPPLKGG